MVKVLTDNVFLAIEMNVYMLSLQDNIHDDLKLFYKNTFAGILKLNACKSIFIMTTIKRIHDDSDIDVKKILMLYISRASVMPGRKN
jgi:hypothetical protein